MAVTAAAAVGMWARGGRWLAGGLMDPELTGRRECMWAVQSTLDGVVQTRKIHDKTHAACVCATIASKGIAEVGSLWSTENLYDRRSPVRESGECTAPRPVVRGRRSPDLDR